MGKVKAYGVAYVTFLAFVIVTALVIRPAAQKFNVPLLKDIL